MREDERLPLDDLRDASDEGREPDTAREAGLQADAAERAVSIDTEQCRQLSAVAELRVCVERQVVAPKAQIAVEERLQPAAKPPVDDERLVAPEEPVVHEHELGARGGRPSNSSTDEETPDTIEAPRRRP